MIVFSSFSASCLYWFSKSHHVGMLYICGSSGRRDIPCFGLVSLVPGCQGFLYHQTASPDNLLRVQNQRWQCSQRSDSVGSPAIVQAMPIFLWANVEIWGIMWSTVSEFFRLKPTLDAIQLLLEVAQIPTAIVESFLQCGVWLLLDHDFWILPYSLLALWRRVRYCYCFSPPVWTVPKMLGLCRDWSRRIRPACSKSGSSLSSSRRYPA